MNLMSVLSLLPVIGIIWSIVKIIFQLGRYYERLDHILTMNEKHKKKNDHPTPRKRR